MINIGSVQVYSGRGSRSPAVEGPSNPRRGLIAPRPDIDFGRTCRWTLPSHTRSNSEVRLDQDRLLADGLGWVTVGTAY